MPIKEILQGYTTAVLSLKKYVPVLLSHMQIYKSMFCPCNKFSSLIEAQSL